MHTSKADYRHAAEKASQWAREKLEQEVSLGRNKTTEVIQQIMDNQPSDMVAPGASLKFDFDDWIRLSVTSRRGTEDNFRIHPEALIQIAEKSGVPSSRRLVTWFQENHSRSAIFANILSNEFYSQPTKKFLIRSVKGTVRGFVSDRYKIIDSGPIIEAFISAFQKYDAVATGGRYTDTHVHVRCVLPIIFEPIKDEVLLFGLHLRTSDFGHGALELKGFVNRLRCTNLMMTQDSFRTVHLGSRLAESDFSYSFRTRELAEKTEVSKVKDVVKQMLSPEAVNHRIQLIQHAAETEVDADAVLKGLRKKSRLTEVEGREAAELYRSAEVELLPRGNSTWRLSNAISLLAQRQSDDRRLELEGVAGMVANFQ